MGYVSKDIAVITEPKIVTLVATPNFVQFASKPGAKSFFEYNIQVNITSDASAIPAKTELRITEPSGVLHTFRGTTNPVEVGGSVFYVAADQSDTAENLRQALLNNSWIEANFYVRIPFVWSGNTPTNGRVLNIKSKGTGAEFNAAITAPGNTGNTAYLLTPVNATNINNDSISGEDTTAEIELDVYTDPAVMLGQDDRPTDSTKLGTFAISMQKIYAGVPLWFELNALFNHFTGYTLPPNVSGWFNTGTARAYRFIAKKRGVNSFAFYQSSALFVLNGYGRASDTINLNDYMYGNGIFKPLTNKPRTAYVRGQKAFLNFIFADTSSDNYTLQIAYNVYSTSDNFLGVVYKHTCQRSTLAVVNTCVLDIDAVIDEYPTAGIVRVSLAKGDLLMTEEIEYKILPECLHTLTQFIFLNRLGGWDAFNFDASPEDEIKPGFETYTKTVTPAHTKGTGIESIYSTSLEHTLTVEGAPVSDEVAEWLKELAAARVVLDGNGNRVIIEDFKLKISPTTINMQVPTIKYHLSETFTND